MSVETEVNPALGKPKNSQGVDAEMQMIVLQELQRILASRFFKNSKRSRQFLEYIVRCKLEGRADDLKERTIGTQVFQRPLDYSTGEDPVVRVQAGEVRRRLEQFYQAAPEKPVVRIELALGSYAPHFHQSASDAAVAPNTTQEQEKTGRRLWKHPGILTFIVLIFALCAILPIVFWQREHNSKEPISVTRQFWAPALASQQPVLLCLAKPVFYRPSLELYRKYSDSHPGTFQTEVERSNRALPLDPRTSLAWGELVPFTDYGVAVGDVEAVVRVSGLLGNLAKPIQVRIGDRYSYEDLRNSPSVLIGAFNNKWTMQIARGLYFEFVEDNGILSIRENSPGRRVWIARGDNSNQIEQDHAIVARLLNSNTGQFTILAAGITGSGTQAAGEFISKPELLEKALRAVPSGWQNKNIEFVLRTNVTDSVAGPPSVVAFHTW